MTIIMMALATWRISSLIADEEGPLNMFGKLRDLANRVSEHIYNGMICQYCNSVWIGAGFVALYIVNERLAFYAALPLALSTITIFIHLLEAYVNRN